jgi:uncharacterized protein YuzE
MTLSVGNVDFDRVACDADADVLYLAAGDPSRAVEFDETPEGHALRYARDGALVGLTIVNARRLLDERGSVRITPATTLTAAELAPALTPGSIRRAIG